ncbi:hypothetical protein B7463_g5527, partial [Scytalidium lignicola]
MSRPIRVGLIGLSQQSGQGEIGPGTWAVRAHLPYLLASPKYEIVALANSSTENAKASIASHKLGPQVKAYGNPDDLANDPDVDLVVISVIVTKHLMLAKPALLAGKDVCVEWPLGANITEAEELAKLAASKGVKTAVGLQARSSPLVVKLRELIKSGKIGKITSTSVVGSFNYPYDTWMAGAEYYLDIESGGNTLTITFGHFFDSFINVLGDFAQLTPILHTENANVKVFGSNGEVTNPNYIRTSPDHIFIQGKLLSGALASLNFRTVAGSPIENISLRWIISGTLGEIEVCTTNAGWQMGPPGATLRMRSGKDGEVETIDLTPVDEPSAVTEEGVLPATNTARLYEAFASGESANFASFSDALATHRALDKIQSLSKNM